ncbi:hypothetical protein FCM35_KLT11821 [Carex littledalei]|uniref:Uncharacterized protein n=1 Tax=Carex littledalei TaxID=544730 RepID=A0A833QL05_9POAL|nr:hypothetical protein FCM35_KLT11821 [Carex littledalei]
MQPSDSTLGYVVMLSLFDFITWQVHAQNCKHDEKSKLSYHLLCSSPLISTIALHLSLNKEEDPEVKLCKKQCWSQQQFDNWLKSNGVFTIAMSMAGSRKRLKDEHSLE